MSDVFALPTCRVACHAEWHPRVVCAGRLLCDVLPDSDTQHAITAFIRERFFQSYGALPELRIPKLLALTGAQNSVLAAVGVRQASAGRLFLEDYLTQPVEALMPQPVRRARIAEIAHLAGVEPGISRILFLALTLWLRHHQYQWIVFTGTEALRNSFARLGIHTHALAPADPARLPDKGAGWGRYYEHQPIVMAADVQAGYDTLKRSGLLSKARWIEADEEVMYGDIA